MYDLVAGSKCVKPSYMLSKGSALERFPMLKRDQLKAAIVYYDGNGHRILYTTLLLRLCRIIQYM